MIRKQFFRNVLPAMLAFAFSGVYAIVDGLFIGQNVGDLGLAAINIAYPLVSLIQAIGIGIGMGGAIQMSICIGAGDEVGEQRFLGNSLTLLAVMCAAVTTVLSLTAAPVLRLLGAQGDILTLAKEYIFYIALFASFQILSTGLVPLVRNYGGSMVAMGSMIAGFLTNVILDWLFVSVLQYSMAGAAVATIIAQAVTVVPCAIFLFQHKKLWGFAHFSPSSNILRKIAAVGLSPFGLTLSPTLVIIIMNYAALRYGGNEAVTCFAVVSYVAFITQSLLQGIGDGCQPLMSQCHGQKNEAAVTSLRRLAYQFAFVTACAAMVGIFLFRYQIPVVFGVSAAVAPQVSRVLAIFVCGFIFLSFLRITASYFYAVKQNRMAYLLIYGEPLLLAALVICVFPPLWSLNGVWMSVPIGQAILALFGALLLRRTRPAARLAENGDIPVSAHN